MKETPMKKNLLLATALMIASTIPSFAADYYIVREGSTGPCKIVESRPTDTRMVVVGGDKVYTTEEEAQRQMAVVCKRD